MTYPAVEPITSLSESESWNLLAGVALGRLVTSVDDQPEVFPVNFVVQNRTVLFRTGEGTKLVSQSRTANPPSRDEQVQQAWRNEAYCMHRDSTRPNCRRRCIWAKPPLSTDLK
jgi:nitroimidazol reductase NimA-like FMN-containing flavoprotein (pyridoxamine 5'-phosphate oxidase superfamily)